MPTGIYGNRGGDTYRGFTRLRMERTPDGFSSYPICEVTCLLCGKKLDRNANAIRKAEKKGGGFRCGGGCER